MTISFEDFVEIVDAWEANQKGCVVKMRDPEREQWESDPRRPLVQSDAWNNAALIWSIGSSLIVALLVLRFAPDWNWKELTGAMMFAFTSGCVVETLSWVYERIKYRDR